MYAVVAMEVNKRMKMYVFLMTIMAVGPSAHITVSQAIPELDDASMAEALSEDSD